MDALIRLDVLMPIAPITENAIDNRNNTTNFQIPNSQLMSANGNHSNNLDQMPEVLDLSIPQVDGLRLHCPDNETATRTNISSSVVILDKESEGCPDSKQKNRTKHKLPPITNGDHSHSKIPRTDCKDFSLALINSGGNSQNASSTSTSRDISCSIIPAPSIMKNHTVTSADVNNGFHLGPVASNVVSTSETDFSTPGTSTQNAHLPTVIDETSLAYKGTNDLKNNMLPHNFHYDDMKYITRNRPKPETVSNNMVQIDGDLSLDKKNKGTESAMFYQILDMFPDIDLKFLENQCRSGLDINQVTEIILEMNDYPKGDSQTSQRLRITPEVVTDVNVNRPNLQNIPLNFSSGIIHPNLADKEVQLVLDKNRNDLSLTSVPNVTSSIVPTVTGLQQDPPIPISEIKREGKEINLVPTNSQLTNVEVSTEKYERRNISTEKKNLLDRGDETSNIESQYKFLTEIFPDADPSFLEIKSKLKENELGSFIAESMENRDYPKIKPSEKCGNEIEDESVETGLYTTNFNLENFITIFPDPFGYFLDEKRICQYTEHGFAFLKRRYRCHSIKLISMKYRELKYNLVSTCEFLDVEKPTRVSKRGLNEIKMPDGTNLPFLQEACFIEHKSEIKSYVDGVAEAKRLAYELAEAKEELFVCGCCFQSVLFEDCAACDEGIHLFCKTCIRKSVEVRIGDAHTTFPCLQDCESVFSLKSLEVLVDPTMFSRLLQRIQLDEVRAADIEGLEGCPFCEFAIILPPETNIFKCLNPECLKESCRKCHKLSHIPQRCEELESDDQARARKYIEDEMTRALVRVCYKCKKSFIKIDGCNKMTCTCGAKMCYICRKPIVNYDHFNGPGGEKKEKCPLYSTEKLLHVDAVEAVAKTALEEVTSKNPELKLIHDPSKILPPAESAKTNLPPGVNEEAARLIHILQNLRHVEAENAQVFDQRRNIINNNRPAPAPAPPHPQHDPAIEPPQQDVRLVAHPNLQALAQRYPQVRQHMNVINQALHHHQDNRQNFLNQPPFNPNWRVIQNRQNVGGVAPPINQVLQNHPRNNQPNINAVPRRTEDH